jgi:diguanylate cyclase (GGDEF)-like protein
MLRLSRQPADVSVADLAAYDQDVARMLERGFRWMYFPARLEQLFERETQITRSRHLVGIGILWIAVGAFYTIFQPAFAAAAPNAWGFERVVRLAVVSPILIAVTFAIWWGVRPLVREFLMMLVNVLAPASIILVVALSGGGEAAAHRGALTIVLLFITVVVRLRFWFATAACLAIVAIQVTVPPLLNAPVPGNVPLVLVTIIATLIANYTLEREYRLNYLQRVHGRIQGARLAETVQQLHELSQRDPLTGLPNRRALESELADLAQRNEQFAVIMVDIDVFKAFNDLYGHQVGDDCLRRVAAILRASLRRTSDRIARIGGEEFAIVLPQTVLEDARITAERMRNAVYGLRIPHTGSPPDQIVSISVGVSVSTGEESPAETIAKADRALYRAKGNGRNCVEVARAMALSA